MPLSKGCIAFLLILIVSALTVGCSEEAVFDLEKFNYINAYVNEILPAIEETRFDFEIWVTDLSNAEKRDWLVMDAEKIRNINQRYFTADFPLFEEIEAWVVPVTNDNKKRWTIQGDELAPALEQTALFSKKLVILIDEIIQAEDEFFLAGKSEEIESALTKAEEAAEKLRNLFHRQ